MPNVPADLSPDDLLDELFGGLIVKRERSKEEQERLERNVARTSNVVGLGAGLAGTGTAAAAYRASRKPGAVGGPVTERARQFVSDAKGNRLVRIGAASALGLQTANVLGDVVTARVLGRGGEKKQTKAARYEDVEKVELKALVNGHLKTFRRQAQSGVTPSAPAAPGQAQAGQAGPQGAGASGGAASAGGTGAAGGAGGVGKANRGPGNHASRTSRALAVPFAQGYRAAKKNPLGAVVLVGTGYGGARYVDSKRRKRSAAAVEAYYGGKRDVDEVTFGGSFSKLDDDKRLAFGWASVVELNGTPVIDRQGDYIALEDIENAAYVYVKKSRVGGDMHRRTTDETGADAPHKVGELVESVVFTPEKCKAMGLPEGLSGKWWIGMHVEDDDAWAEVKKGNRAGFSIHGKGLRKDISYDALMGSA